MMQVVPQWTVKVMGVNGTVLADLVVNETHAMNVLTFISKLNFGISQITRIVVEAKH